MSNMQLIPFKLCCINTITAPLAPRSFLNVIRARKPRDAPQAEKQAEAHGAEMQDCRTRLRHLYGGAGHKEALAQIRATEWRDVKGFMHKIYFGSHLLIHLIQTRTTGRHMPVRKRLFPY